MNGSWITLIINMQTHKLAWIYMHSEARFGGSFLSCIQNWLQEGHLQYSPLQSSQAVSEMTRAQLLRCTIHIHCILKSAMSPHHIKDLLQPSSFTELHLLARKFLSTTWELIFLFAPKASRTWLLRKPELPCSTTSQLLLKCGPQPCVPKKPSLLHLNWNRHGGKAIYTLSVKILSETGWSKLVP